MRTFGAAFLVVTVALGLCGELQSGQGTGQPANSQPAAQQEHKRLTNADVVGMVKAGLAESTILLAIEQNPSDFETSPAALVELKKQGVSASVMEAMMRARDSAPAVSERLSTARPPSNDDKTEGVELLAEGAYYKGPTGWVKLEQITMAGGGATHVAKMLVPGLTPQIVWTFRGAEAPVQISERRPALYVKQSPYMMKAPGNTERDIVLVRFDKKKDHRELQTTSGGNVLTFKSGFSKEKTPGITVTRLSETIFKVAPNGNLQPGEYFLTFGAFGAYGYDFGITGR